MPTFSPPVAFDVPTILPTTRGVARALFRHFTPRPRGRTVVKVAGHYVIRDVPYAADLEGLVPGVDYFLGGHVYAVTDAVASALISDGFTVT